MFAAIGIGSTSVLSAEFFPGDKFVLAVAGLLVAAVVVVVGSGMRYIPNNRVGIVEKL